ncbi:putative nonribosomal peptide synthase [Rosellinia necatrix]|uniref:Putative nonribosomal peptide synthase n=1 Tax=Rosellinia necatrix TaxID=77044 RepID=A0A1W2TNW0_ROSNE|nr:putative nonribosomal peptide synthase [Rosellinia necatrix]
MTKEQIGAACKLYPSRKALPQDCDSKWRPLEVPLSPLVEEMSLVQLADLDLAHVIEVLWAIVLREYTGCDQVSFHRIHADEEMFSSISMDLDQNNSTSFSKSPSIASLIAARRASAREAFSTRESCNGNSCDTAIYITNKRSCDTHTPPLQLPCIIIIEVQDAIQEAQCSVTFWYRSPKVSEWEAANIAGAFQQIMRSFSASYYNDIDHMNLLCPKQKEQLLQWKPGRGKSRNQPTSLLDIVQRSVQNHANDRSIEAWDGDWTYGELEAVSCSLAMHFRELGVQPGDMVLLLREKSKWTVAGMMAILMLAAVCVPVDIRQPKERVRRIIERTNARWVLTSAAMTQKREAWSTTASIREICIPLPSSSLPQSNMFRLPAIAPDTIAFVFFTSGSTGTPKGVVQGHSALALTAGEISRHMRMDSSSKIFQYSSYSFDVSVGDIFATFLAGGCLCIPSEDQRLDQLYETINEMKATHLCTTPTVLAGLTPEDMPSLRQVTVGGESLTREQLRAWHPRIATIYGTTESVIWDTYHDHLAMDGSPTNIGCGMGLTTTWIVDPWNAAKLVPIGAIGELLIGGPSLSQGYLNDEARTKMSFLEKPSWLEEFLAEDDPGRLYRTGDLVRYNPDGTIEYIGRKDQQIKINGQRVELGEIEYNLRQSLPDGTACAVEMIRPEFRRSQKSLAAFIDSSTPILDVGILSTAGVREQLAKSLPSFMIPSLFVLLEDGIPKTPTGKVDRTRLRQMGSSLGADQVLQYQDEEDKPRDPETSRERLVQSLYKSVLGIDDSNSVHMGTNFFQHGGTSIHAVQFVSLARKHGHSLSAIDIFENPRLADLAAILRPTVEGDHPVAPFSLLPLGAQQEELQILVSSWCDVKPWQVQDVFPCTPLQEGLLALSSKDTGDYVQQAVFELPASISLEQFREAYDRASRRIPILRCRAFALPQADHRIHLAVIDEREEWFTDSILDRCSNRDREKLSSWRLGDRLSRCSLVTDSTQRHYFVWTIHHALFDGWSLSLILDEIERNIRGLTSSHLLPFQNFVHYMQNMVDLQACERFWRSRLDGSDQLHFPPYLPSGYQPSGSVEIVRRGVHDIQWPTTGITPSAVIQGAWAVLLSRYSASTDITFGATVIGRHAAVPGIEFIAGPTIATIPLRVQLEASQSISEYLRQLQLDAIRTVPYEQLGLSEIKKVSADAEKACGFQVLLVVQPPDDNEDDSDMRIFDRSQTSVMGNLVTYAVTLQCWLGRTGSVDFQLDFDETVVDHLQGERLLSQLETILRRLCIGAMDNTTLMTALSSSCEADVMQIQRWNAVKKAPSLDTVLQLITKQVEAHPHRLAVDAWDGALTYQQLDLHSSSLAYSLERDEAGHMVGKRVVVCLEKSHLAIVAFLAVLKAGGVCIFVDPAHAEERIRTIIRRSQAHLALANEAQSRRLSQWVRTIVIPKNPLFTVPPAAQSFTPPMPADDACIVFTSGSTGEPKGIRWNHQVVAATALGLGEYLHLSHCTRLFQFSSYAFDVNIHETTATLVRGGCVCVPSEQSRQDSLEHTIASSKASTIILTPSVAHALAPENMPCIKQVVFCGEPLPLHVAQKWSKHMTVYNWYGPAECSLATWCDVKGDWQAGNIGTGASALTWIVHPENHEILQPVGAIGELLLQGPGVASGYDGDPARTAQAFIKPPKWWQKCQPGVAGTFMYRTGDLAQYANDGSLILLGRKDKQVKIRGQRVELEEIEGALQEILGTGTTITVDLVKTPSSNELSTLAAFVHPTVQSSPDRDHHIAADSWVEPIQARLAKTLPSWMIPTVFFIIKELPLSPTGKVDRKKLQELGISLTMSRVITTKNDSQNIPWEPPTPDAAVLGELWAEVLGLPPDHISSDAHFIRLGGNSIDAMRLAAASFKRGYLLSVRDILATPCIADLARQFRPVHDGTSFPEQSAVLPFSLIQDTHEISIARRAAAAQCKVREDEITDIYPCTALQPVLLALTSKTPGDYVSRSLHRIQGDPNLFKSAWETVVATTPILRTRIVDLDGKEFYQVLVDEAPEWNDEYSTLDDYLEYNRTIPIGLGTPLVRWGIVSDQKDGTSSFTFIWTIHHSLYDGWSLQAILNQVERAYRGQPLAPTVPFQAFVRYTMTEKKKSAAERFWMNKLEGFIAAQFPKLPSLQYLPRARRTIDQKATTPRQSNHTMYTSSTVLRAAWALVLARYSRSSDVVFGATVLGRQAPVPGIGDMIGPTIATVPVRVRWSDSETVEGLLRAVHEDGVAMIPFEQVGLARIRRLGPGPEDACRFGAMLIVQPPKEREREAGGLFDDLAGDADFGVFGTTALVLRCSLAANDNSDYGPGVARFYLDYDPDVIGEDQARRILCQMDHTFSELSSASPSTKICELPLLNASDLGQILEWNGTPPEPVDSTVTDLFNNIVDKFPSATAVHAWDAKLSFQELNQLSTNLARHLISLGLKSQQCVPLCFEKSAWTVVAIFGVLKAGGMAVLLEPSQPEDRLRSIIKQLHAPLVMTSARNEDLTRRLLPSCPLVTVDKSSGIAATVPDDTPLPQISPSSPVYMIFTSGSTGVPKGVMISHSNVCSALKYRQTKLSVQPGDRVLDGVSYAFDVSWGNILFTLCSGACLCVPASLDSVGSSLIEFRVTVVGIVSSVARLLDCKQYPDLRVIIFGGEGPQPSDVAVWAQDKKVFNSYGPAECTVSVCLGQLNGENRVHVGRGTGVTTWIVDDTTGDSRLASIGTVGELWLEGPQVGMGYFGDPDKTAASFIEEPAWLSTLPAPGSNRAYREGKRRFYRTGDLAQYYPDGMVRLVGRKDSQAKLRGQRIELEEVELHVKKLLPGNIEVAAEVIVPQSNPTRQFLVVFIVSDPSYGLPPDEVKNLRQEIQPRLSQILPSYMCPSAYIPLPSIPRLAAGKINRVQLRETGARLSIEQLTQLSCQQDSTCETKRAPRTPLEKTLRDLYAEALGLDPSTIGVDDSFLQLTNGDSINVMRLVRLAEDQNLHFSVADVFMNPCLGDLATKVVCKTSSQTDVVLFSLWRGPWTTDRLKDEAAAQCGVAPEHVEDIFPCTALQEGLLALTSTESTMYACREVYELNKDIDVARFKTAWETVTASTPILRTRIIDIHPYGLHQVIINEPISWGSRDIQSKFSLGGRLAHWTLLENATSIQFIWTIHHSLYDGWSMPRILEQVERAYYQEAVKSYLPMQPFIGYLAATDEDASQAFWRAQLATRNYACYLPELAWPTSIDVTPTAWIRAAWALLIGHITNTDDIIFGATVSGRQAPVTGIQDIIGPTISTVPVRVKIDWGASIETFLRQLQQQATDMIPFEHVGLHRLRRMDEDAKQASQFRTLLDIQPATGKPHASRLWTHKNNESQGQFNDFALILDVELQKSGVFFQLNFDEDVIPQKQAERLTHQLEAVLLQLDRNSLKMAQPLGAFHLINSHDLSDIWKWNAVVPEESSVCLHDIIHEHVKKSPSAPAVDAWDGQLTYEALDEYSMKLASYLQSRRDLELGSDSIVALCFEKSMWTVVAALAVMKMGNAFTLMDTSQPDERLQTIASQVNQHLIISSASNAERAARIAKHVVVVDHDNLSRWPRGQPLNIRTPPSSKLYVVFTSGSTGTPKGAVITHSNFSSAVRHQGAFLGYSASTRVYDFASYAFDIAVSNLLHCLAAGGCLCIPSDVERQHRQLAESMRRMDVNVVDLTPSVARTLDPTAIPSLRTLILGGEAASRADILRWAPYVRVLNGIGQAECTVTTTMAEMDPAVAGTPGIGKAMGTNTWIVSPTDHNQLVAIGAVGELLVEGPLVGAGYLNDEAKTAAAFIQDPHWLTSAPAPGWTSRRGRLYKTGDLVRYDAEGGLHFIGRKDAQTKIRGQRIELEEVEYHVQRLLLSLSIDANVAAEAVILSGASMRSAVLVVFACPSACPSTTDGSEETSDNGLAILEARSFFPLQACRELNTLLESTLPSAMLPFVYVPVNRIPLAPTGKTDRKRLKTLGASLSSEDLDKLRGFESKPKRPPTTPAEKRVRDLWAEILAIPAASIGIDDNFIQLGGDSISAMRLLSLARSQGLSLDSRDLLLSSSVLSDLALSASHTSTSVETVDQLPFTQLPADDISDFLENHVSPHIGFPVADIVDVFPVTDFQAVCIRAAQQTPPSFWNYFYTDLALSGLGISALSAAWETVAMHFPILRTVFVPYNDTFYQVVTRDRVPDFVRIHVKDEHVSAASERLAREDWLAADCSNGSRLARVMLLVSDAEPENARLIIRMSHALYDGFTLGRLLEAIAAAIDGRQLPTVGSFASFIHQSTSTRPDASQYWGKLLSGSTMTTIPAGLPIIDSGRGTPYIIKKTAENQAPMPKGITAATVSTACWAAAVASVTQQADVVFGRLVSGRGSSLDANVESIAGPCLNVVPLRVAWPTKNKGHVPFPPYEVFASVQQQHLDGIPFESIGLSQIVSSCTDWPVGTTYGSIFQFQNIDEDQVATISGAPVHLNVIPTDFYPEQLWMLVKPLGRMLEVRLFGTTAIMAQERAQELVDMFCNFVAMEG